MKILFLLGEIWFKSGKSVVVVRVLHAVLVKLLWLWRRCGCEAVAFKIYIVHVFSLLF